MNRFLIVRIPEGRREADIYETDMGHAAHRYLYAGTADIPIVLHFDNAKNRDNFMPIVTAQYPGRKFVPVDVNKVGFATAGPMKMMTVDERGMLPA